MTTTCDPLSIQGLSANEAAARLRREGYNELPSSKRSGLFRIALDIAKDPIFLLLSASGLIYVVLGDMQEALMLLGFVAFIMAISVYQEHKTERALEALRDMTSPRALVIRDGAQTRIPGREVVRGDILILSEGDRVPADAGVLWCTHLTTDESLLTGESVPVRKTVWDGTKPTEMPGGDDLPFVYSGTLVVQGKCLAQVVSTGFRTEIGKIGKALEEVEQEKTPLQSETGRLVKHLAAIGLALCALVVVAYGFTHGDWLNGFLAGIALAMAILPNEFPVVLTIFLALGAWRMSQQGVLTRRVPAIETLGSATVLCVDKTGTLTLNRMTVRKLCASRQFLDIGDRSPTELPEAFHKLVEFSILASQPDPFDPMERALKQFGERFLAHTEHLHGDWNLVREYPLSPELLALSHVWKSPSGEDVMIGAKGAPEAVADLCHFSAVETATLLESVRAMAREGLRVLAVAQSYFPEPTLPDQQHDFHFAFLGLIGFADPVRPSVSAAMQECTGASVRVVMITGDYPDTAQSIAREIGLVPHDLCITGTELDLLSDAALQERIRAVNVFARVVPAQKLRIVNALKSNGDIVAMTGDGVNDAPALKAAHIGIAMGERGTDVAREAASLVLLDDDFSSIVQAIKAGRRIFDNLKKAIAYLLAIHIPIAGISLIPVPFRWPLVLLPIHIAFLHLIIDPACSIVFEAEPEERNVMKRPPRNPTEPLFGKPIVMVSLLQGCGILAIIVAIFVISLSRGQGEDEARALTFTTLIVANLGLILTNRSWMDTIRATWQSANPALWWVVGGALLFLGCVLYVPFLRDLFRFSTLHFVDLALCCSAGVLSIAWFEILKMIQKSRRTV
jgi:Ca2+-transporting ATPase